MFSGDPPVSRPRPPAQMRRSHSMVNKTGTSPPPPYVSAFACPSQANPRNSPLNTLLGSPVSATFRRLEREASSPNMSSSLDSMDWLDETSREELSDLLIKADGVIRQRESELDRASVVVKSLYDDNVALKSRHSGLFARFPSPSILSPSFSLADTTPTHISDDDISRPFSNPRHVRRISIRPDDLNLLSDQNSELLQKLEKLETESASADLAGRRMLTQLQKEIDTLREDLERTQLKSMENEEQVKKMKPLEIALKRQVERERRMQASPSRFVDSHHDESQPIMDYAPGGPLSQSPTRLVSASVSVPDRLNLDHRADKETLSELAHDAVVSAVILRSLEEEYNEEDEDMHARLSQRSDPELALVSELLAKIQQLEETNSRIVEQQAETANKVSAVQRETESMTRLYESLSDPRNELVREEADPSEFNCQGDTTIRFRSYRRTIEGDAKRPLVEDSFFSVGPSQPRKSVLDVFNLPSIASTVTTKSKGLSIPFESPAHQRTLSAESQDLHSPPLSSIHFSSSSRCSTPGRESSPSPFRPCSLQSELGEDWSLNAPHHHPRNNSLYSFGDNSAPVSPSSEPESSTLKSLFSSETESCQRAHGFKTPVRTNGLQLTLEPPTPEDANLGDAPPSIEKPVPSSPSGFNYERSRRMSQTIRSRTHRWVNGRFTDSVLSPSIRGTKNGKLKALEETDSKLDQADVDTATEANRTPRAKGPRAPFASLAQPTMPRRVSDAFDNVVEKFHGHRRTSSDSATHRETSEDSEPNASNTIEVFMDRTQVAEAQKGFQKVVVEVWMWLQFGIIILVFLWAMARKGPRSVLVDAEKKRGVSSAGK